MKQKKILKQYDLSKMVKVNDGHMWNPCYPGHFARVHLNICYMPNTPFSNTYLVVSGMDDTFVEKRFESDDLEELIVKWNEYRKIYDSIPETTNLRWYLDRGFVYG